MTHRELNLALTALHYAEIVHPSAHLRVLLLRIEQESNLVFDSMEKQAIIKRYTQRYGG